MKRGKSGKRGQLNISFGMIFSIILIVVFLGVAVFAIIKILNIGDMVKTESFVDDFKGDVETFWKAEQGTEQKEYFIPNKIKQVCFEHGEESPVLEYVILMYEDEIEKREIEHLTFEEFCLDNKDGKIKLTLTKNFGESLVTISE